MTLYKFGITRAGRYNRTSVTKHDPTNNHKKLWHYIIEPNCIVLNF